MTLLSPYLDASVAVALTVLLTEPAPAGTVFVTGKVVLPPAATEYVLFAPSSGSMTRSASPVLWSVTVNDAVPPCGTGCASQLFASVNDGCSRSVLHWPLAWMSFVNPVGW